MESKIVAACLCNCFAHFQVEAKVVHRDKDLVTVFDHEDIHGWNGKTILSAIYKHHFHNSLEDNNELSLAQPLIPCETPFCKVVKHTATRVDAVETVISQLSGSKRNLCWNENDMNLININILEESVKNNVETDLMLNCKYIKDERSRVNKDVPERNAHLINITLKKELEMNDMIKDLSDNYKTEFDVTFDLTKVSRYDPVQGLYK